MKLTLMIVLGFIAAWPLSAQSSKETVSPTTVTLCELARNPAAFNDKKLVVTAHYMTDYIERSLLFDDACPGGGMLPYLQEHAVGADEFNDAVWVRPPAHLKQSIVATFTGTFHFANKPEMCMFQNKDVCRRSFEIERVDDLVLTMTPIGSKK